MGVPVIVIAVVGRDVGPSDTDRWKQHNETDRGDAFGSITESQRARESLPRWPAKAGVPIAAHSPTLKPRAPHPPRTPQSGPISPASANKQARVLWTRACQAPRSEPFQGDGSNVADRPGSRRSFNTRQDTIRSSCSLYPDSSTRPLDIRIVHQCRNTTRILRRSEKM